MSNLFLTLVIAFVIIVLAIASLAIGWLFTGKTKLERGACGRDPTQKQDDSCNSACNLCSTHPEHPPFEENLSEEGEDEGIEYQEGPISPSKEDSSESPSQDS